MCGRLAPSVGSSWYLIIPSRIAQSSFHSIGRFHYKVNRSAQGFLRLRFRTVTLSFMAHCISKDESQDQLRFKEWGKRYVLMKRAKKTHCIEQNPAKTLIGPLMQLILHIIT